MDPTLSMSSFPIVPLPPPPPPPPPPPRPRRRRRRRPMQDHSQSPHISYISAAPFPDKTSNPNTSPAAVNSSLPHSNSHSSANSNTVPAFHRTCIGKDISDVAVDHPRAASLSHTTWTRC